MMTTTYIKDVSVTDGNGAEVYMELHKSPSGGFFCVEGEFLDQVNDLVYDPYGDGDQIRCQTPEEKLLEWIADCGTFDDAAMIVKALAEVYEITMEPIIMGEPK